MKQWLDRLCIKYLGKRQYVVAKQPLLARTIKSLKDDNLHKSRLISALRRMVIKSYKQHERDRNLLLHKEYTIEALSIALDDAEAELDRYSGR